MLVLLHLSDFVDDDEKHDVVDHDDQHANEHDEHADDSRCLLR